MCRELFRESKVGRGHQKVAPRGIRFSVHFCSGRLGRKGEKERDKEEK